MWWVNEQRCIDEAQAIARSLDAADRGEREWTRGSLGLLLLEGDQGRLGPRLGLPCAHLLPDLLIDGID